MLWLRLICWGVSRGLLSMRYQMVTIGENIIYFNNNIVSYFLKRISEEIKVGGEQ